MTNTITATAASTASMITITAITAPAIAPPDTPDSCGLTEGVELEGVAVEMQIKYNTYIKILSILKILKTRELAVLLLNEGVIVEVVTIGAG